MQVPEEAQEEPLDVDKARQKGGGGLGKEVGKGRPKTETAEVGGVLGEVGDRRGFASPRSEVAFEATGRGGGANRSTQGGVGLSVLGKDKEQKGKEQEQAREKDKDARARDKIKARERAKEKAIADLGKEAANRREEAANRRATAPPVLGVTTVAKTGGKPPLQKGLAPVDEDLDFDPDEYDEPLPLDGHVTPGARRRIDRYRNLSTPLNPKLFLGTLTLLLLNQILIHIPDP